MMTPMSMMTLTVRRTATQLLRADMKATLR
jgi:hypothetical protein